MRRSSRDTEESARRITRRGLLLGGAQLGFMGLLGLRMRYMQVEQADEFRLLAEENRVNLRLLPPARGLIYDRNGVILAENEQNYRIVLVREDAGDVDQVLARLSQIIHLDPEELERARKEIFRRSPFVPVTVADRLSWEEFAEVSVNAPALPGITPEVGLSRHSTRTSHLSPFSDTLGLIITSSFARSINAKAIVMVTVSEWSIIAPYPSLKYCTKE